MGKTSKPCSSSQAMAIVVIRHLIVLVDELILFKNTKNKGKKQVSCTFYFTYKRRLVFFFIFHIF